MLKLYNTVMGTYMNMPDHYAGVFPFVEAPEDSWTPGSDTGMVYIWKEESQSWIGVSQL